MKHPRLRGTAPFSWALGDKLPYRTSSPARDGEVASSHASAEGLCPPSQGMAQPAPGASYELTPGAAATASPTGAAGAVSAGGLGISTAASAFSRCTFANRLLRCLFWFRPL